MTAMPDNAGMEQAIDFDRYDRIRPIRWTGEALELLDQRALPFELAPLEQQAGGNAFLPRHQRHAHAGFVGAPHQC